MLAIKQTLCFLCLLLLSRPVAAQPPSWQWAQHGQNAGTASGNRTAIDAAGNLYSAGNFSETLQLGDSTFACRGLQDVFLARYKSDGTLDWARQIGDTATTACTALAVDRTTGDIYIAGTFQHWIRLQDSVHKGKYVEYVFANDIFLAKYNVHGDLSWRKTFGTYYNDVIAGLDVDSRHNLVMGGSFVGASASPPVIDSMELGSIQLVGKGDEDIFVAKCDSGGLILWARNLGGRNPEHCDDLCLDRLGNIIISGGFSSLMPFYGTTLRGISVGLFAGSAFIAKLDPDGEGIWAKSIGGIGPASGTNFEGMYPSYCAVDSAGNPYIGGNFTGGTLIFDATDRSTALPGGGQWIAKYGAADGAVLWTKRPGRGGFTRDLGSDRAGNLYLTGSCALGAIYGNDTVRSGLDPRLPNLFVLSVDPQGGQRWLRTAGDLAGCVGLGIDVYHPDEPAVAGTISGGPSVDFGTSTCYNTGTSNGFVAKLRPVKTAVAGMNTAAFSIYPNPAQSELNLEQPAAGAFCQYRLLNALGQRVASGGLRSEQRQRISLPALTAGIYYLELSGAGGIARRAVSIQP